VHANLNCTLPYTIKTTESAVTAQMDADVLSMAVLNVIKPVIGSSSEQAALAPHLTLRVNRSAFV
jgi:hypothetical protein